MFKKILYVTDYLVKKNGDEVYCDIDADKGLRQNFNNHITFVGVDSKIAIESKKKLQSNKFIILNYNKGNLISFIKFILSNIFSIWNEIKEHDLVMIKVFQLNGFLYSIIAFLQNKKVFASFVGDPLKSYDLRNDLFKFKLLKITLRKILKSYLDLICNRSFQINYVSKSLKNKYQLHQNNYSIANESWLLDKNFTNFTLDSKKFSKKKKLKMIFVGRVVREKGLFLLFEVLNELKKLNYKISLSILGEGKDKQNLENLAMNFDIEVNFLGYVESQSDEIYHQYQSHDVMILPSFSEGLPLSILEAFSAKTFVIASNVGGISEIISDEITGFLIEPNSKKSLMRAIKKLYNENLDIVQILDNAFKVAKLNTMEIQQKEMYNFLTLK